MIADRPRHATAVRPTPALDATPCTPRAPGTHGRARPAPSRLVASCAALAGLLAACGGASPRTATVAHVAEAPPSDRRWRDRAVAAYLEGDLARAATAADSALQLDPGDTRALEVAARVALARLDPERALSLLGAAQAPLLVRLRARAHLGRGDLAAAQADLDSVAGAPPEDGWAAAVAPALRAAAGRVGYAISGDAEATIPFDARAPDALATIALEIDGRRVHALVSTAAGLTVVDDALARGGTLLGRVALGGLVVEGVPALARDLADVSAAAGTEIAAVVGADLLLRLHATLDGPGRAVTFRARPAPPPAAGAQRLDLYAFEGSLLAVRGAIDAAPATFFALDSSAALPVALTARAIHAEGVTSRPLPTPPGTPEGITLYALAALRLGDTVVEGVPAVVGVVPDALARVAGTRIDGMLGLHVLGQLVVTFDPIERAVLLAQPASAAPASPPAGP